MFRDFLDDAKIGASQPHSSEDSNRRFNKMILIGTPEWVMGMIYRLHASGVAEAGAWTRLLPTGNPGEVISTLLRYRSSQSEPRSL